MYYKAGAQPQPIRAAAKADATTTGQVRGGGRSTKVAKDATVGQAILGSAAATQQVEVFMDVGNSQSFPSSTVLWLFVLVIGPSIYICTEIQSYV